MKSNYGFSLVELVVVIAIVGIIAALGINLLGNNNERAVKESQTRFVTDLSRIRTLVQRHNVSYQLSIATDKRSYTLTPQDKSGTTVANVPLIVGTLASGVTLEAMSTAMLPVQIYRAPFGRFGGGAAEQCYELVGGATYRAVVSLIGVTGKIVARQVLRSGTTGCI